MGEEIVRRWHRPRSPLAQLKVPFAGRGRERRPVAPGEVELPYGHFLRGIPSFSNLRADAVVEIAGMTRPDGERSRYDLFVEYDRTGRPEGLKGKFTQYDAFITGWARILPRYKEGDVLPSVVFVCQDEPKARAFARAADARVTGAIGTAGRPPEEWHYPGRRSTYFVAERDAHEGLMRAWRMPALPPRVRRPLGLGDALEELDLVDPRLARWATGQGAHA